MGTVHSLAASRPQDAAGAAHRRARTRWAQWGAGAAVALLAGAGYAWLAPVHRADPAGLARLVAAHPPKGFTAAPTSRRVVQASQTGLSRLSAAAAATSIGTAAYSVMWKGDASHGKAGAVAEALVAVVPSSSDAAAVRAEARTRFLGATHMKAAGYSLDRRFAVRAAPGSQGATFTGPSSSPTASTVPRSSAEIVMGTGRTALVLYVEGDAGRTRAAVSSLAAAEQAALDHAGPDFSPAVTSYPLVTSVVTAAGAAVALLVVALGPALVGRVRERRAESRRRAAERERLARGRKVVKRHAAGSGGRAAGRRR